MAVRPLGLCRGELALHVRQVIRVEMSLTQSGDEVSGRRADTSSASPAARLYRLHRSRGRIRRCVSPTLSWGAAPTTCDTTTGRSREIARSAGWFGSVGRRPDGAKGHVASSSDVFVPTVSNASSQLARTGGRPLQNVARKHRPLHAGRRAAAARFRCRTLGHDKRRSGDRPPARCQ